jgi:hypothetical protein
LVDDAASVAGDSTACDRHRATIVGVHRYSYGKIVTGDLA